MLANKNGSNDEFTRGARQLTGEKVACARKVNKPNSAQATIPEKNAFRVKQSKDDPRKIAFRVKQSKEIVRKQKEI